MISNTQRARPVPFGQVLARHVDPGADLVFGGDKATTVLLCGGYHFAAGRSHPLRDILPPLIHLTTAAASAGHDLALVLLTREVASRGIGTATVNNRLGSAGRAGGSAGRGPGRLRL